MKREYRYTGHLRSMADKLPTAEVEALFPEGTLFQWEFGSNARWETKTGEPDIVEIAKKVQEISDGHRVDVEMCVYAVGFGLTRAFDIKLYDTDELNIGTDQYKGRAWYHSWEYKYLLRDVEIEKRKRVHDNLLAAGLTLNEASEAHDAVIAETLGWEPAVVKDFRE